MSNLPKINAPTYRIELSGKKYNFRPFLVKEEKLILIAMESESKKEIVDAVVQVLESCVSEKIDIRNLPLYDLMFLFVNLRMKSKGEVVDIGLKCSDCSTSNKVSIDLEKVILDGDTNKNMNIEFENGIGVKMKYPCIDVYSNEFEIDSVKGQFDVLLRCLESISTPETVFSAKDYTTEELNEFIDDLPEHHFDKIMKFMHEVPKLKLDVDFTCKQCSKENKHEITDFMSFLS